MSFSGLAECLASVVPDKSMKPRLLQRRQRLWRCTWVANTASSLLFLVQSECGVIGHYRPAQPQSLPEKPCIYAALTVSKFTRGEHEMNMIYALPSLAWFGRKRGKIRLDETRQTRQLQLCTASRRPTDLAVLLFLCARGE